MKIGAIADPTKMAINASTSRNSIAGIADPKVEDAIHSPVVFGPPTFVEIVMESRERMARKKVVLERRYEEAHTKEFRLFSKLPAELRIMVWKFALPGPRVIDMNVYWSHQLESLFSINGVLLGQFRRKYGSRSRTPSAFHVNQEGRTEALKAYASCSL